MATPANVYILTFCRNLELFYGTELIFRTLRTGFPNAPISVVDNNSLPEARCEIERLARDRDCRFVAITGGALEHHEFLEETLKDVAQAGGPTAPLVFLDPDICLWKSCESFAFEGLIAGKKVAEFEDSITATVSLSRLHTSFLWIPDPARLRAEILEIRRRCFDFEPFRPVSFRLRDRWYRFDTGASLCSAFPDRISRFTEDHLSCYDHIYGGSHIDWLFNRFDTRCRRMLGQIHACARDGNLEALRGIWKYQDAVFGRSFVRTNTSGRAHGT